MDQGNAGDLSRGEHKLFSPVLRLALLLGVLVHLLGFFFLRVISNPLPVRDENLAYLSYLDADSLENVASLEEQAMLFDSAPLFIPGRWSSASAVFPQYLNIQTQSFPDYEPDINIESELKPERIALFRTMNVDRPEDLLDLRFWDLFRHFGQGDFEQVPFDDWEPFAEVYVVSDARLNAGNKTARLSLDADFAFSSALSVRPVVFYQSMSAPGVPIGKPVMRQSSGVEEIDEAALEWLQRTETLAKLPSGYVEVRCYF